MHKKAKYFHVSGSLLRVQIIIYGKTNVIRAKFLCFLNYDSGVLPS